jgi:hypothetical protein
VPSSVHAAGRRSEAPAGKQLGNRFEIFRLDDAIVTLSAL